VYLDECNGDCLRNMLSANVSFPYSDEEAFSVFTNSNNYFQYNLCQHFNQIKYENKYQVYYDYMKSRENECMKLCNGTAPFGCTRDFKLFFSDKLYEQSKCPIKINKAIK